MSNSALCAKAKVIYFPAPKNAGSSMRQYLFHIDNGRPYESMMINGKSVELFMIYGRPGRFQAAAEVPGFERFVLVRDPISRFLSAYANRILDPRWRNPRHEQLCQALSLPAVPDLEMFVQHLDAYRKIPEIAHHTRSQRFFFGDQLSYYHKVFRVENIADAIDYLAARSGVSYEFPALKTDGPKVRKDQLSAATRDCLGVILREDYALLESYYTFGT